MVRRNVRDGLWHRTFIICKRVNLRAHGAPRSTKRRLWFTSVERRYVGSGVWYYRELPPTGLRDEPGLFTNLKAPLAVYGCLVSAGILLACALFGAGTLIARVW